MTPLPIPPPHPSQLLMLVMTPLPPKPLIASCVVMVPPLHPTLTPNTPLAAPHLPTYTPPLRLSGMQALMYGGRWRLKKFTLIPKSPCLPSAMQGRATSWQHSLRARQATLTWLIRSRARTTLHSLLVSDSLSSPWHFWLLHISAGTCHVLALDHRCRQFCNDEFLGKSHR